MKFALIFLFATVSVAAGGLFGDILDQQKENFNIAKDMATMFAKGSSPFQVVKDILKKYPKALKNLTVLTFLCQQPSLQKEGKVGEWCKNIDQNADKFIGFITGGAANATDTTRSLESALLAQEESANLTTKVLNETAYNETVRTLIAPILQQQIEAEAADSDNDTDTDTASNATTRGFFGDVLDQQKQNFEMAKDAAFLLAKGNGPQAVVKELLKKYPQALKNLSFLTFLCKLPSMKADSKIGGFCSSVDTNADKFIEWLSGLAGVTYTPAPAAF